MRCGLVAGDRDWSASLRWLFGGNDWSDERYQQARQRRAEEKH